MDIALTHADTVEVMLGNGDGSFSSALVAFAEPNSRPLASIITADLNGDGTPDLVVTTSSGDRLSYVLLTECLPVPPPTIVLPPADVTTLEGTDVSFSVEATSLLPLSFQWQENGKDILNETNATLSLPSVQVEQSGAYAVVVRTPFTSITSTAATLVVNPKPRVPGYPDVASLKAALQATPTIAFNGDGYIAFVQPLIITSNTTLDGTGHTVFLDGVKAASHFIVTNGASLRLINLHLIDGRAFGAPGSTNAPGNPGMGGAILNNGGRVEVLGCTFVDNQALGGQGGPTAVVPVQNPVQIPAAPTGGGGGFGGAICSLGGELSVSDSLFTNNSAFGAVGHEGVDPNIPNGGPTFGGPGGDSFGGAIFSSNAVVTLMRSTFTGNSSQASAGSEGRPPGRAGLSYGGSVATIASASTVSNCVFSANQGVGAAAGDALGGAFFQDGGSALVDQTLFASNSVAGGGGVLYTSAGYLAGSGYGGAVFNNAGLMTIQTSALVANRAVAGTATGFPGFSHTSGISSGGGVYNKATLLLANSTVADNSAVGANTDPPLPGAAGNAYGGALSNDGGTASFLNVTVANNSVQIDTTRTALGVATGFGASLFITNDGMTRLTNSILFAAAAQTNVWGSLSDGGHNISSDASAAFTTRGSHNGLDPLLGVLGNYGGPTPTIPLLPGSPAVDSADTSVCPPTDQRGVPRPVGTGCDIGAFELTPTLRVVPGPNGNVQIDYLFEPGQLHQIEASTNLMNWLFLGSGKSDTNGLFRIEDSGAQQFRWRFYRVH